MGDDREEGFYWIRIGNQLPEVAQWQVEWGQWFRAGKLRPTTDIISTQVIVLSDVLVAPRQRQSVHR